MIKKLVNASLSEAEDMLDLQLKSYAVEAELLHVKDFPPLRESVDDIIGSEETFYGVFLDGLLAGMYSYCLTAKAAQLCRLVVHPSYFRRGIASILMEHFLRETRGVHKIFVTTGKKNTPAVSLYEKFGFSITEEFIIEDGITILRLEKVNFKNDD